MPFFVQLIVVAVVNRETNLKSVRRFLQLRQKFFETRNRGQRLFHDTEFRWFETL